MKIRNALLAAVGCLALAGCGQSIDSGEVGLYKHFGKVEGEPLGAGWQWYNPFSSAIITMNTRALKWVGQKSTYTHDVQQADIRFALTYRIDPVYASDVYRNYGTQWAARLMPQIVQQSVGDEFGKWDAVKIIEFRDKVQRDIYDRIAPRLRPAHIELLSFDILAVRYNEAFENAVEQKQVAIQRAIEEQNHTVQVKEQAAQKVLSAEAEAKAIGLEASALAANQNLVHYRAIQKWDGKLPQNMYGGAALPFVDVTR